MMNKMCTVQIGIQQQLLLLYCYCCYSKPIRVECWCARILYFKALKFIFPFLNLNGRAKNDFPKAYAYLCRNTSYAWIVCSQGVRRFTRRFSQQITQHLQWNGTIDRCLCRGNEHRHQSIPHIENIPEYKWLVYKASHATKISAFFIFYFLVQRVVLFIQHIFGAKLHDVVVAGLTKYELYTTACICTPIHRSIFIWMANEIKDLELFAPLDEYKILLIIYNNLTRLT